MSTAILSARQLRVHFPLPTDWPWQRGAVLKAVDGINLDLHAGETLGVVGESGCGKSTLARALTGLQPATEGAILLDDVDITGIGRAGWQHLRKDVQMVFQDPLASLNPRMTVGEIVAEPLRNLFPGLTAAQRWQRVVQMLQRVGLSEGHVNRYPHEFSGGQCQRIGIARALVVKPRVLICDEPVSALDVSIQAQIINLLMELQHELELAIMFIAHDLAVVRHISQRILVMYLGRTMEQAPSREIFIQAMHPYTKALLSAVPVPDPTIERRRERIILEGDLPSPANPPSGCVFRTRCPWARPYCAQAVPTLRSVKKDRQAACHFAKEINPEYLEAG